MNPKTFCIVPWAHVRFNPTGTLMPCCKISHKFPTAKVTEVNFNEWWNGKPLRDLRQDLTNGTPNEYCSLCWDEEAAGKKSLRQEFNKHLAKHTDLKKIYNSKDGFNTQYPISLDLNLSNICNYKCIMCSPMASSRLYEEEVTHQSKFKELKFFKMFTSKIDSTWPESVQFQQLMIDSLLPNLKIIDLKGGEPLLVKNVQQMIESIPNKSEVILSITTNGSISLADSFIKKLQEFKHIWMCVSVDGIGEVGEYIRYGSTWDTVNSTIQQLSKLSNCTFRISTVLQFFSSLTMPGIVDYANRYNFKIELLKYIGDRPFLSINAISPEVMRKFKQYAEEHYPLLTNYLTEQYKFDPELHRQCYAYVKTLNSIRNNGLFDIDTLFDQDIIAHR